jgi:transitional endoplasmic reticulum ATPase
MNRLNSPPLFLARWTFVALYVVGAFYSLTGEIHLGPNRFYWLLAATLAAALAVCAQDFKSYRWVECAFFVVSVGTMRLLFSFNVYSFYGIAIWLAALLFVVERRRQAIAQITASQQTAVKFGASPQAAPQQTHGNAQAYSFSQNVRRARCSFADLVGMSDTKKRLLEAGKAIVGDEGSRRNGILLFGDAGNGKTMLAEALAGELNVPFFSITYGDVASKWINETPQKVEAVFRYARQLGRCVLSLDEFDSFAKPRSDSAHSMDRDLANVLLTAINDLHGTKVILVCMTNFIDNLDAAAIREGRFDFRIEVPPPDYEARRAILRKSIGAAVGLGMVDNRLISSLAARWEGFSASRLASLGGPLTDMRRDGAISPGRVTFEHGMQAMRLLQGRRGTLPEDVKSVDEIIMPEESRNALRDLAFKMKQVHRLEQIGGCLPTGLIFFGPPGTGKTHGAMALAKASGYAFLKTTGANIMGKPDSWDRLVREAKDIRPAIVFIDEAEDILAERRYSQVGALTNRILTTLDGANGKLKDVIFIAATNHFDRLDGAVIRGGRFEEKIWFDVPAQDDMQRYVLGSLRKISDQRYVIVKGVHERCLSVLLGRSIADADAVLNRAVNAAAVRALRETVAELRPGDISDAARAIFAEKFNSTV